MCEYFRLQKSLLELLLFIAYRAVFDANNVKDKLIDKNDEIRLRVNANRRFTEIWRISRAEGNPRTYFSLKSVSINLYAYRQINSLSDSISFRRVPNLSRSF